jgi:hypothetical protein
VAESPIDQRRYADREVREILKRAAENAPPEDLATGHGLSLAEVKAIGMEVGIDPVRIEDAARAFGPRKEPGLSPILGVPTVLQFESTVAGELDTTRAAGILSVIRRAMGHHGEASEVSGSLEWRTKGGPVDRLVTVSSTGGRTTLTGSANLRQAVVGTYVSGGLTAAMLTFIGIAASVGGDHLSIAGLALSAGFLAAAYVSLRAMLMRVFHTESGKLERVVHELAQLAKTSGDDSHGSDRAT